MKKTLVVCLLGVISSLPNLLHAQNNAPPPYHSGPLNIIFRGAVKPMLRGRARVLSTPLGIDCPGVCSFQFAPGQQITLTITADQESYASGTDSFCPDGGSTVPMRAGNTISCVYWHGAVGNMVVYVDPFPLPTNPSILGSGRKLGTR
jgi:hypothetical protein